MERIAHAISLLERVMISGNELVTKQLNEENFKGLSLEQYEVLNYLKIQGDKYPSEIAKFQGVQKSAVSNRLSKLLTQGYIEYVSSPTGDKRYKHVHLTDAGIALLTQINEKYCALIQGWFEDFEEDEQLENFISTLTMIQQRIDEKGAKA